MPNGVTSHDPQIFTSWKEIATYLGKGVRTVQRWEAQFGLPVQRPNSRSKGIVRASREELDQWIATRWSSRSLRVEIPLSPNVLPRADAVLKTAVPLSGVNITHQLRTENRRLLNELENTLRALKTSCKDLVANLERSRTLHAAVQTKGTRGNESRGPV